MADDDLLRYKFFQAFDELMHACENRFEWLSSPHQYVTVKNNENKVIAFERGDLFFVFNFHPCQSFSDYQIGLGWNEPMRCVLDSDEGRFGGHMRLEYGHSNSFPPLHGVDSRPHSVKLYLPARTAQVLVKESLLQGGVRIFVSDGFLAGQGLESADGLTLKLQVWKDGKQETTPFKFKGGCIELGQNVDATFSLETAEGKELACGASKDGLFRVYFPGAYTISGSGYLANGEP